MIIIIILSLPVTAHAYLSKKNRISLLLKPLTPSKNEVIGTKHIDIVKNGNSLTLRWYSQQKIMTQDQPWPVYRVELSRGILVEDPTHPTNTFVHPHLWREGLLELKPENRILFAPSLIVEKKSKRKKHHVIFEPGIIKAHYPSFKKGPEFILKTIREFREILGLLNAQGLESIPNLDKNEKKSLIYFIQSFAKVGFIQKTKTNLLINSKPKTIDTIEFGNPFIRYTCLDDVKYPLIIKMEFIVEKIPNTMKPFLDFFKKYLEFKVTNIAWDKKASAELYREVKLHKIEDEDENKD